jgi:two-component system response regulator MprA
LEELLARVRSMLRRSSETPGAASFNLVLGDLTMSPTTRRVTRGDRQIELTKLEFDLLETLLTNIDVVVPRDTLYERVWGYDADLASNTLEVFVSALRRKTEADGETRLIHTVRGVGYVARLP